MRVLHLTKLLILQFFVSGLCAYADVESRSIDAETSTGGIKFVESGDNRSSAASMGVSNDLYSKVDTLQKEIQELRGTIEEQQRIIERFALRQDKKDPVMSDRKEEIAASDGHNSALATPSETPFTKETPANNVNDELLYTAGYELLKQKNYSEAELQFNQLVQTYPHSQHVPTAHYWLGEIRLLDGKLDEAEKEFKQLVSEFPTHRKTADALLKLGIIAKDRQNKELAKQYFSQVIQDFPNSQAAQVADKQLKRLM